MPLSHIETLEQLVQGDLRPDRVLVLDLPPGEGARRARKRGASDRFELEAMSFFDRVRAAYLARARRWPDRYRIIDASASIEQVSACVRQALEDRG
jgi:dTMP kinase